MINSPLTSGVLELQGKVALCRVMAGLAFRTFLFTHWAGGHLNTLHLAWWLGLIEKLFRRLLCLVYVFDYPNQDLDILLAIHNQI